MHFPYKEHTFLLDDKTFENIEIFLKHKDNLETLNEQNTDIEVENSCGPRCPICNVVKDLLECPRSKYFGDKPSQEVSRCKEMYYS